jgi:hypothetical protein
VGEQQLDLFSTGRLAADQRPPQRAAVAPIGALDDAALLDAIADSNLAASAALAAEAGRRGLQRAIPALEALCRRFAGFGIDRSVPEQAAALEALTAIGGRDAADAVARMIARSVVEGPTLRAALDAAAQLRASLSTEKLRSLLQHPDPLIRAQACRCARPRPELVSLMVDLLDDLHPEVARAAACALGQMGRPQARGMLTKLLRDAPGADVIGAIATIADEECMVVLGRIARTKPELSTTVCRALEEIDHPRADAIAARLCEASRPQ